MVCQHISRGELNEGVSIRPILLNDTQTPLEAAQEAISAGYDASPNYIHVSAPGWKFGPGHMRVESSAGPIDPPEWDGTVAVIDDFSFDDRDLTSGHGDFIANLVAAAGLNPVKIHLQFKDENTDQDWPYFGDQWSVAAALHQALALPEVDVVNMSFGTYPWAGVVPHLVRDQIAVLSENDLAMIAGAGNDAPIERLSDLTMIDAGIYTWRMEWDHLSMSQGWVRERGVARIELDGDLASRIEVLEFEVIEILE